MWGFICPIKLLNWMFYLKLNFIFSFRVPQKPTQLPLLNTTEIFATESAWSTPLCQHVQQCCQLPVWVLPAWGGGDCAENGAGDSPCQGWWLVDCQRSRYIAHSFNKQTHELYYCNVLHAEIHIEQFEHLCFPFSLMLYYSTFKSCKHLLLLFLLGCMLHKAAPFGI